MRVSLEEVKRLKNSSVYKAPCLPWLKMCKLENSGQPHKSLHRARVLGRQPAGPSLLGGPSHPEKTLTEAKEEGFLSEAAERGPSAQHSNQHVAAASRTDTQRPGEATLCRATGRRKLVIGEQTRQHNLGGGASVSQNSPCHITRGNSESCGSEPTGAIVNQERLDAFNCKVKFSTISEKTWKDERKLHRCLHI